MHMGMADGAHVGLLLAGEGLAAGHRHARAHALGGGRARGGRQVFGTREHRQPIDGDQAADGVRMVLGHGDAERAAQAVADDDRLVQVAAGDQLGNRGACIGQRVRTGRRAAVEARQRQHVYRMLAGEAAYRVLPGPAAADQARDQDQRTPALAVAFDQYAAHFEALAWGDGGGEAVGCRRRRWGRWGRGGLGLSVARRGEGAEDGGGEEGAGDGWFHAGSWSG
jgi:hypothetical protein